MFRGRFRAGGRWHFRRGWQFCGDGGGSGGGGFRIGGKSCCEAGLGLLECEDVFLLSFESSVGGRKKVQCRWASLLYGDAGS